MWNTHHTQITVTLADHAMEVNCGVRVFLPGQTLHGLLIYDYFECSKNKTSSILFPVTWPTQISFIDECDDVDELMGDEWAAYRWAWQSLWALAESCVEHIRKKRPSSVKVGERERERERSEFHEYFSSHLSIILWMTVTMCFYHAAGFHRNSTNSTEITVTNSAAEMTLLVLLRY